MGVFDSVKKDKIMEGAKGVLGKVQSGAKDFKEKSAERKAEADSLKAPIEGSIARYEVTYKGGWKDYPKNGSGALGLNIMPDSFIIKETIGSKDWFSQREIPYDNIRKLEIIKRTAGNWEVFMGSGGAESVKATETENVIAITYEEDGVEVLVRLEMLTGFTVYAQQEKCREFMDILRQNQILKRINREEPKGSDAVPVTSAADELKKYKDLLDMGAITQEEFDAKKKVLLGL